MDLIIGQILYLWFPWGIQDCIQDHLEEVENRLTKRLELQNGNLWCDNIPDHIHWNNISPQLHLIGSHKRCRFHNWQRHQYRSALYITNLSRNVPVPWSIKDFLSLDFNGIITSIISHATHCNFIALFHLNTSNVFKRKDVIHCYRSTRWNYRLICFTMTPQSNGHALLIVTNP